MNIVINVFENPFQCIRVFPCYMSKPRFRKMMSSDVLAVLFFFSFFPKTLVSEASAEREKEK